MLFKMYCCFILNKLKNNENKIKFFWLLLRWNLFYTFSHFKRVKLITCALRVFQLPDIVTKIVWF